MKGFLKLPSKKRASLQKCRPRHQLTFDGCHENNLFTSLSVLHTAETLHHNGDADDLSNCRMIVENHCKLLSISLPSLFGMRVLITAFGPINKVEWRASEQKTHNHKIPIFEHSDQVVKHFNGAFLE